MLLGVSLSKIAINITENTILNKKSLILKISEFISHYPLLYIVMIIYIAKQILIK